MIPLKNGNFDISMFFALTPDLVCIAGKDGYFRKINKAVVSTLEYTEEELLQRPIASFIHPEDRALTHKKRQNLLKGETLVNFQNRYCTKSGREIWLHWTSVYFPDQEVVFAIAKDVTEKKLVEQEMEARSREFESLARYFKQTMEKDRKYVALELHEELAQLASMVKMNMDWLDSHLSGLSKITKGRMEQISILSERMVHTIRKITFSFSPGMLEDLGLKEALAVLCREFTLFKGIPCTAECRLDPALLTPEEALDFFRICQETLGIIESGSLVAKVMIRIENKDKGTCLQITLMRQDGNSSLDKQQLDLTSIRKRVASINGQISTEADKGKNLQMTVFVPLHIGKMTSFLTSDTTSL